MVIIGNDVRLKELDFRLLLTIHDELIGECPENNYIPALDILVEDMLKACENLRVPFKCDVTVSKEWYGENIK